MSPDEERQQDVIPAWWGTTELAPGAGARWVIGPLALWIGRRPQEWRLAFQGGPDPLATALDIAVPSPEDPLDDGATRLRFGLSASGNTVTLTPALADRPVVTRPETPFYIPAGEEIRLFVSSPVWCRVTLGEGGQLLHEVPAYRPSDTWFGPSTREGELSYASRTHCRLRLEDVPIRPHRAVTAVLIRNRAKDPLLLERLNLPVPALSLFAGRDGHFWTEAVTLVRAEGQAMATLQQDRAPPAEAHGAKALAMPRRPDERNRLFRAFDAFFR